jgi:hypothetical protein
VAGRTPLGMADVLYLVITVAFFAATVGFVRLCDKVIGPDSDHPDADGAGDRELESASGAR